MGIMSGIERTRANTSGHTEPARARPRANAGCRLRTTHATAQSAPSAARIRNEPVVPPVRSLTNPIRYGPIKPPVFPSEFINAILRRCASAQNMEGRHQKGESSRSLDENQRERENSQDGLRQERCTGKAKAMRTPPIAGVVEPFTRPV